MFSSLFCWGCAVLKLWNCSPKSDGKNPNPAENVTPPVFPPKRLGIPFVAWGTSGRSAAGRLGMWPPSPPPPPGWVFVLGSTASAPLQYSGMILSTVTPALQTGQSRWLEDSHRYRHGLEPQNGGGCVFGVKVGGTIVVICFTVMVVIFFTRDSFWFEKIKSTVTLQLWL